MRITKRHQRHELRPGLSLRVLLALTATLFLQLLIPVPLAAQRPERAALAITGYVIDAELDTTTHHLAAKTVVAFTAPETLDVVSFGFHPALKISKITDDAGKLLTGERTADGTIRVTPASPFSKGQVSHWTFEYEGTITGNEDGPIEGLKLAAQAFAKDVRKLSCCAG